MNARCWVFTTGPYEEDWPQLGHRPCDLKHLLALVQLAPAAKEVTSVLGMRREKFVFVNDASAGLYLASNPIGRGWSYVAYYGLTAPTYLLRLLATPEEALQLLSNPRHRKEILENCEQIFRAWVTVG